MSILKDYLKNRGLKYTELSVDERKTYDRWDTILSSSTHMPDLAKFMKREIIMLNTQLKTSVDKLLDPKLTDNAYEAIKLKQIQIVARIKNYEAIISLIYKDEHSKKKLVQEIKRLIAKPIDN